MKKRILKKQFSIMVLIPILSLFFISCLVNNDTDFGQVRAEQLGQDVETANISIKATALADLPEAVDLEIKNIDGEIIHSSMSLKYNNETESTFEGTVSLAKSNSFIFTLNIEVDGQTYSISEERAINDADSQIVEFCFYLGVSEACTDPSLFNVDLSFEMIETNNYSFQATIFDAISGFEIDYSKYTIAIELVDLSNNEIIDTIKPSVVSHDFVTSKTGDFRYDVILNSNIDSCKSISFSETVSVVYTDVDYDDVAATVDFVDHAVSISNEVISINESTGLIEVNLDAVSDLANNADYASLVDTLIYTLIYTIYVPSDDGASLVEFESSEVSQAQSNFIITSQNVLSDSISTVTIEIQVTVTGDNASSAQTCIQRSIPIDGNDSLNIAFTFTVQDENGELLQDQALSFKKLTPGDAQEEIILDDTLITDSQGMFELTLAKSTITDTWANDGFELVFVTTIDGEEKSISILNIIEDAYDISGIANASPIIESESSFDVIARFYDRDLLASLYLQKDSLETLISNLGLEIEIIRSSMADLEIQIGGYAGPIVNVRAEIAGFEAEISIIQGEINIITSSIDLLNAELSAASLSNEEFEAELNILASLQESLLADLSTYNELILLKGIEIAEYVIDIDSFESDILVKDGILSQANQDMTLANSDIRQFEADITNATTDMNEAFELKNAANTLLGQYNSELSAARAAIDTANEAIIDASTLVTQYSNELSLANTDLETVQSSYDSVNSTYLAAESSLSEAQNEYDLANTNYTQALNLFDQAQALVLPMVGGPGRDPQEVLNQRTVELNVALQAFNLADTNLVTKQAEFDTALADLEAASLLVTQAQVLVNSVQSSLDNANVSLASAEASLLLAQAAETSSEALVANTLAEKISAQNAYVAAELLKTDAESNLANAQASLATAEALYNVTLAEKTSIQANIASLDILKNQAEADLASANASKLQVQADYNAAVLSYNAVLASQGLSEAEIEGKNAEIGAYNTTLASKNALLNTANTGLTDKNAQLLSYLDSVASLEASIGSYNDSLAQKETELSNAQADLAEVITQINEMEL
ncbi:MAG: hypothetical protein ABIA04_02530 [Pseudomonadota bacterium]